MPSGFEAGPLVNSADTALRARADRVIPSGLWGHLNADRLPEGYPQYFTRAEGCRLHDVDGRVLIDFMCSWGVFAHPPVRMSDGQDG